MNRQINQRLFPCLAAAILLGSSSSAAQEAPVHRWSALGLDHRFGDRPVDRLCHFRFRGRVVSRRIEDAIIKAPERVAERALKMAIENKVTTIDGTVIELQAETLCVHGDTPGAARLVKSIRELLEAEGVAVEPMSCNGAVV